jgi:hypothetical protein
MQDVAVEVESNILAVDQLRNKADEIDEREDLKPQPPVSSTPHPQVDELTKLVKSLSARNGEDKI